LEVASLKKLQHS